MRRFDYRNDCTRCRKHLLRCNSLLVRVGSRTNRLRVVIGVQPLNELLVVTASLSRVSFARCILNNAVALVVTDIHLKSQRSPLLAKCTVVTMRCLRIG